MSEEKKRIFVADDDEAALRSLEKLLLFSGFEVLAVAQAQEIVPRIKLFKPHLILLDLLMPKLGGLEVCEILNQDPETQAIPIIVVSGLLGHTDMKMAYQLGVLNYVSKPYDFNKLLQEIQKAIAYKDGTRS